MRSAAETSGAFVPWPDMLSGGSAIQLAPIHSAQEPARQLAGGSGCEPGKLAALPFAAWLERLTCVSLCHSFHRPTSPSSVAALYLRDLAVELSDRAQIPTCYSPSEFQDSTHAVVERYLDRLPRRKVRLADVAKVILRVGPRPSAGIGAERGFVVYAGGVAFLWMHDFERDLDLERYAQADRAAQQQMLLAFMHDGLLLIAGRTGDDPGPFQRAARELLGEQFPLPEIPDDELRRRWGLAPPLRAKAKRSGRLRQSKNTDGA